MPPPSRRYDLTLALREGAAWSLMVGSGETFFAAFVLALGLGEVWAGWITTFPILAGGVIQLATPYGVNLMRSRRRWVVTCAVFQGCTFLPLIGGVWLGVLPGWVIFAVASLYWAGGLGAGPAWNAWMTWLVPARLRARYFARRTAVTNLGVLVGLVGAGGVLQFGEENGFALAAFAIVFGFAGLSRWSSAWFMSRQTDSPLPRRGERIVPPWQLARKFLGGRDGRLIGFLALMTVAVSLASPFFTPYMLVKLQLSYAGYMVLLGASFGAKVASLALLGKAVDRWGPPRVFRLSALGIAIVPALWLISNNYVYLFIVQVASGAVWAGYELASLLLFFDHIRPKERTSLLTAYNLINSAALVVGSILGGVLLESWGTDFQAYHFVFVMSAVARMVLVIVSFALTIRVRSIPKFSIRTVAVRPSWGGLGRPIHGGLKDSVAPEGQAGNPVERGRSG